MINSDGWYQFYFNTYNTRYIFLKSWVSQTDIAFVVYTVFEDTLYYVI